MKIENLKDLKKLIQLCRAQGVNTISVDGVTVELGDQPQPVKRSNSPATTFNEQVEEVTIPDAFTQEQMLMWSAAPGGIQSGPGDN